MKNLMKNKRIKKYNKQRATPSEKPEKKIVKEQPVPLSPSWVVYVINFFVVLILLQLSTPQNGIAQTLGASVFSCGAGKLQLSTYLHRSTIGQSVIGKISNPMADAHHLGFWNKAFALIRGTGGIVISLPIMSANVGDTVSIPLVVVSSSNILNLGQQDFTTRIRFNNTVLRLLDASVPLSFEGGNAVISLKGTIKQEQGIIATLRFKVMMGDAPRTALQIDTFGIGASTTYNIVKKNGELSIKDLCEAGDTTRLIYRVAETELLAIRPNPVESMAEIDLMLSESGFTTLTLTDLSGRNVATIWEGEAVKGLFTKIFVVGTLGNGQYFLQLKTPNELFVSKLIISK
jgi:hypothetical protein